MFICEKKERDRERERRERMREVIGINLIFSLKDIVYLKIQYDI